MKHFLNQHQGLTGEKRDHQWTIFNIDTDQWTYFNIIIVLFTLCFIYKTPHSKTYNPNHVLFHSNLGFGVMAHLRYPLLRLLPRRH